MGDVFTALVDNGFVLPASVLLVVVVLLAAWRDRRQAVVRDLRDLATSSSAPVAGLLTPRRTGPVGTDTRQVREMLATVADELGPGPATLLVVGADDSPTGEAVASTLAVAADDLGDRVTLVRPDDGPTPAPVPETVHEYTLTSAWLAGEEPDQEVLDLLEHVETEDEGSRTVLVAAPAGGGADAARGLAPHVDAALVVVELGATRRAEVSLAVAGLEGAGLETVLVAAVERSAGPPASDRRPAVGIGIAVAVTTVLLALVPWVLGPDRDAGPGLSTAGGPDAGRTGRAQGPGLSTTGIHLAASSDALGGLRVVEQVVTDGPVRAIHLAPPPAAEGSTESPRLVEVQISADGVALDGLEDVITAAGTTVRLPGPTSRLELTYGVTGADARSPAAPPGRATLSLRPATQQTFSDLPVVTQLDGGTVLALVCPEAPRDRRLCGVDRGARWSTRPMPAVQSAVVALVDLGAPAGDLTG